MKIIDYLILVNRTIELYYERKIRVPVEPTIFR